MPLDSIRRSSLSTWNDDRTVRWFEKLTVTHSPAATWRTSGSGSAPFSTAAAELLGTNAARAPWLPPLVFTSTAVTLNVRVGALRGHGLPGPPAGGGLSPVGVGNAAAGGGVVPGSCWRSADWPRSTRMIPHAPWRWCRPIVLPYR